MVFLCVSIFNCVLFCICRYYVCIMGFLSALELNTVLLLLLNERNRLNKKSPSTAKYEKDQEQSNLRKTLKHQPHFFRTSSTFPNKRFKTSIQPISESSPNTPPSIYLRPARRNKEETRQESRRRNKKNSNKFKPD